MPVVRHVPMYTVWEVLNQTETDGAIEWGALGVEDAARCHARKMDRDEPLETFPRDFMVIDPDGVRWRVSVDRVIEYDYRAEATQEKANARTETIDQQRTSSPVRAGTDDRRRGQRAQPHATPATGRSNGGRGEPVHVRRDVRVPARKVHRDGGERE